LAQRPARGATFIIELPINGGADLMATVKSNIQHRFASVALGAFFENVSATQLKISVSHRDMAEFPYIADLATSSGLLEFRLVHERSDEIIKERENIPPGYEELQSKWKDPENPFLLEKQIVRTEPLAGLSGHIVQSAINERDNFGTTHVNLTLHQSNAPAFIQATHDYVGRKLAIIIDGRLYSAPRIAEPLINASVQIADNDSEKNRMLAAILNQPFPVEVTLVDTESF
jgi:preprotein translocase subunit SecD